MSIRLLMGLACLLLACSDSPVTQSGSDVSSGWFGVTTKDGALSITRSGRYQFLYESADRSSIKFASGQLEASVIDQLEALLTKELRQHYYEHRTADEQRCRDQGGYSLVHFGGCWIVDEVTDDITKAMLDALTALYKEKEAEALASPNVADSDASVPTTTLGTPHR